MMECTEGRREQNPDPNPSQLCTDVKTEVDEETSISGGPRPRGVKEETLNSYNPGDNLESSLNIICIKEEESEHDDQLYCEECQCFFINKCEVHGPALFKSDTEVPVGVPDRARLTLPPGLEIQESSIPGAGLGVFNKAETVPVGAHFGPYQGQLVDREEAVNSGYSWMVYKSKQSEVYIDAKRETHANWMRYVNCARSGDEQNLVAFQYRGEILYRCSRPIQPGLELLVWYHEDYAKDLSIAFDYLWNKKCSSNDGDAVNKKFVKTIKGAQAWETQPAGAFRPSWVSHEGIEVGGGLNDALLQVFSCTLCPLSYTSRVYLHRHIKRSHYEEYVRLLKSGELENENLKQQTSLQISDSYRRVEKKSYQCAHCGKTFTHHSHLRVHLRIHTGEKPYHCSQCGKRFCERGTLKRHQRIHTGEKPYVCSQCGKTFTHKGHLQSHQRLHTGEKPYHCVRCGKSFTHQNTLQHHQHVHTGEKPYSCMQCGKSFARQNNLQTHQRVHTGEKPYCCLECGKTFSHHSNLQSHQRIHTGEKLHRCSQCGRCFSREGTLQRHQRIHTGEKPYCCSHCGRSFTHKNTLLAHQRTHTGEKPYRCSQCGVSFAQQGNLQTHQRIHTGEKPYRCVQCGKSFTRVGSLQRHRRVHTGEKPYYCSWCGLSFSYSSTFKTHKCRNLERSADSVYLSNQET